MARTLKEQQDAGIILFWCIVLCALVVLFCPKAHSAEIPKERAVNAIIGEAEGESYRGKLAIACSLRIRGDLRGVYGEHSQRVIKHLYGARTFVSAVRAWEESAHPKNCEFIHGASFWEGAAFPVPYWARNMELVAVIGRQRFYGER